MGKDCSGEKCPVYAPFFGAMGAACAMVFSGTFYYSSAYCSLINRYLLLLACNKTRYEMAVSGYCGCLLSRRI